MLICFSSSCKVNLTVRTFTEIVDFLSFMQSGGHLCKQFRMYNSNQHAHCNCAYCGCKNDNGVKEKWNTIINKYSQYRFLMPDLLKIRLVNKNILLKLYEQKFALFYLIGLITIKSFNEVTWCPLFLASERAILAMLMWHSVLRLMLGCGVVNRTTGFDLNWSGEVAGDSEGGLWELNSSHVNHAKTVKSKKMKFKN